MDWNSRMKEMNCTTKECDIILKNLDIYHEPIHETMAEMMLERSSNEFITTPDGNILILTDRLYDLGLGLQYYLCKYTNFHVLGVAVSYENALELTREQTVDILIVCGYQSHAKNYQVIPMLRRKMGTNVVMWALLDGLIHSICVDNQIKYQYSKYEPVQNFIRYILEENLAQRHLV